MIRGMGQQYKEGAIECRDFTDGSKVCISKKAWSIFYATLNKRGAKDTEPMPKHVSETEDAEAQVDWYVKKLRVEESERVKKNSKEINCSFRSSKSYNLLSLNQQISFNFFIYIIIFYN